MRDEIDTFEVFEKISVNRNITILQKRLAELRCEKNLTQLQLSYELDVSRSSIASWENGTRLPDAMQLNILARFFDVTVDYLLGFSDERLGKVMKKLKTAELT